MDFVGFNMGISRLNVGFAILPFFDGNQNGKQTAKSHIYENMCIFYIYAKGANNCA
jgi:hypothetical protein